MKVTFILPGLSRFPVGGYKVIYQYANYFASKGHKVTLVHVEQVPSGAVTSRVHLKNLAIKIGFMGERSISWFHFNKNVNTVFVPKFTASKIPDADAVIATAWYTAKFVSELDKSKGRKYYFIQHYEVQDGYKDLVDRSWKLPLEKIVIASWLQELGNTMGVRTKLVKNFINHDIFFPVNLANRKIGISMLVHAAKWKGTQEGLRVLKAIYRKYPWVEIRLFGLPERPNNLPNTWKYYKDASSDQLREKVYGESTIFLFPSHKEGWGLTASKAMACGNALVSTDNGGIDDFGFVGKNAVIVKNGDEIAMEHAISFLLENPKVMKEYQRESLQIAKKLTLKNSGEKFLRIIS